MRCALFGTTRNIAALLLASTGAAVLWWQRSPSSPFQWAAEPRPVSSAAPKTGSDAKESEFLRPQSPEDDEAVLPPVTTTSKSTTVTQTSGAPAVHALSVEDVMPPMEFINLDAKDGAPAPEPAPAAFPAWPPAGVDLEDFGHEPAEGPPRRAAAETAPGPFAWVPIDSSAECGGTVPRVACSWTLVASAVGVLPSRADFKDALCGDFHPHGGVNPQAVSLCIQFRGQVGAVARVGTFGEYAGLAMLSDKANVEAFGAVSVDETVPLKRVGLRAYYPDGFTCKALRVNVGNFVWEYGARRLLNPYTNVWIPCDDGRPCPVDALVLSTANILVVDPRVNGGFQQLAKTEANHFTSLLQQVGVPAIMLGIGIQANSDMNLEKGVLSNEASQFLRTLSSTVDVPNIGARGRLSSEMCQRAGVGSCVPAGCPSLFLNHTLDLGVQMQRGWASVHERIRSGERLKCGIGMPSQTWATGKKLLHFFFSDLFSNYDCSVLLQTPTDLENIELMRKEWGLDIPEEKVRYFCNVEEWRQFLAKQDFFVGARIHGTMAATSAGLPSLAVPTDRRIEEMVQAMGLAWATEREVLAAASAKDLLLGVRFDGAAFDANRRKVACWYHAMFRGIDIRPHPELELFAQGCQ